MASDDFTPLLTEFKSFLDRDPVDRRISELVELLERIFPTSDSRTAACTSPPTSSRNHNRTLDLLIKSPDSLLPPNAYERFPWIPKPSAMPPRSGSGQGTSHNHGNETHTPAGPVSSHSHADHTRASDGRHDNSDPQSDVHMDDEGAPSSYYTPSEHQSVSQSQNTSASQPVATSHASAASATPATPVQSYGTYANPRTSLVAEGPRLPSFLPHLYRDAPAPASHPRTGSQTSSSNPTAATGYAPSTAYASSYTSAPASDTACSQDTPNANRSMPWPPAPAPAPSRSNRASGYPRPDAADTVNYGSEAPGAPNRQQPLQANPTPVYARPPLTNPATSFAYYHPEERSFSSTPSSATPAMTPRHGGLPAPGPPDSPPPNAGGTVGQDEGEGTGGASAGGPQTTSPRRPGGEVRVPDEKMAEVFANTRPGKHYHNFERKALVDEFFDPNADVDRVIEALSPLSQTGSSRIFAELSERLLEGTRSALWLHGQLRDIKYIYVQICIFRKYHLGLDFNFSNEEQALQHIAHLIAELKSRGIKIDIHPWHLLIFVRESWFWQIDASIGDLPSVQTETNLRSGLLSSPMSAPSRLPTQSRGPPRSSAPPRSRTQASAPSHPPAQAPQPSHRPQQSSAVRQSSSRAYQAPVGPGRIPTSHAHSTPSMPPPMNIPASSTRTPSASSLRIPRTPASGRVARQNISAGGSAGARTPKHSRSTTGSGLTGRQANEASASASTGPERDHDSNPPLTDERSLMEAERLRQNLWYHEELLAFQKQQAELDRLAREREAEQDRRAREQQAQQDLRARELQFQIVKRTHSLTEAEIRQRMALRLERAALNRVNAEVGAMATQHQMNLNAAAATAAATATATATIQPHQVTPADSQIQILPPTPAPAPVPTPQISFSRMMGQARANLAQSLGPDATHLPPYTPVLALEEVPAYNNLEPGNGHAGQDVGGEGRFEDLGTVAGSPQHMASMDGQGVMEGVGSLLLGDDDGDIYDDEVEED